MRRVGVLLLWPENDPMARASTTAFARALAGSGWIEGKNIQIDYSFAAGIPALFRIYAAELVRLSPDPILPSPGGCLEKHTLSLPVCVSTTRTVGPQAIEQHRPWSGRRPSRAGPAGRADQVIPIIPIEIGVGVGDELVQVLEAFLQRLGHGCLPSRVYRGRPRLMARTDPVWA
jgi:hypothetical protein